MILWIDFYLYHAVFFSIREATYRVTIAYYYIVRAAREIDREVRISDTDNIFATGMKQPFLKDGQQYD